MKKRRILLALIMLIISGISLTTATYAWFTANREVYVENMNVKATASGGIQISADAVSWSNEVSFEKLEAIESNVLPENNAGKSLMPLTTIGSQTTGQFDFYLGELDAAGSKVKLTKETESSSNNMLAFDLYFYSASDQTIIFDDTTKVTANTANLEYSMRVGFLYQGNDDTATPATALDLKEGTSSTQKIWEPFAKSHTEQAVIQFGATQNQVYTTKGGMAATTDPEYVDPKNDADHFRAVNTVQTDDGTYPTDVEWVFPAGINKMRVYVWIEGQDVDCEDTASLGNDNVTITLGFTIKEDGE